MVTVTLDAVQSLWKLALCLVQREGGEQIAEAQVEAASLLLISGRVLALVKWTG